jgi:hypothetical protein
VKHGKIEKEKVEEYIRKSFLLMGKDHKMSEDLISIFEENNYLELTFLMLLKNPSKMEVAVDIFRKMDAEAKRDNLHILIENLIVEKASLTATEWLERCQLCIRNFDIFTNCDSESQLEFLHKLLTIEVDHLTHWLISSYDNRIAYDYIRYFFHCVLNNF